MIVATVWAVYSDFLYLRSSKNTIYCTFVIHFAFFFLSALRSPLSSPPEESKLKISAFFIFYQGTFTLNLQDTTFPGCRWSLTRGEQSAEEETWMTPLHFELNPPSPPCSCLFKSDHPLCFPFYFDPAWFSCLSHVFKVALRRKQNQPLVLFLKLQPGHCEVFVPVPWNGDGVLEPHLQLKKVWDLDSEVKKWQYNMYYD